MSVFFESTPCDLPFFRFVEMESLNGSVMKSILDGEYAGCIFRNAISSEICQKIARNFWSNVNLSERDDAAPGLNIGTFHYGKELSAYFTEVQRSETAVSTLFEGTENVFEVIIQTLAQAVSKEGIEVRRAQMNGNLASCWAARTWRGQGLFSLHIHEDVAQMRNPIQSGFEIQKTTNFEVIALNICIENTNRGKLQYWAIQPNDNDRKRHKSEYNGYPYPLEHLDNVDSILLPVNAGDVYLFNGANLHAVRTENHQGDRIIINCFLGYVDERTIIFWA